MIITKNFSHFWLAERSLITITQAQAGQSITLLARMQNGAMHAWQSMATYKADNNGSLIIDVTDLARTYNITGIALYSGETLLGEYLDLEKKGLIDPSKIHIPNTKLTEYGAHIIPPSMMVYDMGTGYDVYAEFFADNASQWDVDTPYEEITDGRIIDIESLSFNLWKAGTTAARKHYELRQPICGRNYAYVEWLSFSGVIRKHYFEVVKNKMETENEYSLFNIKNEYTEIKGRRYGFTLRLDGLDEYDLWYYADIISSSSVSITLDYRLYRDVQITTKNITLPDGDAKTNGVLEINVNYSKYDAVTL